MHGYIALVLKRPEGGYRVTFPDLPGCRAAGRSVEGALGNAKPALKAYATKLRRRGASMPPPRSSIDVIAESAKHGAVAGACIRLTEHSLRISADRALLDARATLASRREPA